MLRSLEMHLVMLVATLRRGGLLLVVALALTVAGAANVRAQSKAATPAGSETPPVVRYVGMRQGRVGEPFVLRARVRDGATAAPLAGAPLVFTVGDREIEAVTGPNGIAEATMVLTADLAEARVTVTYKGAAGSGSGLLAAQSDAGGSAGATAQVEAASLTPTALTATVAAGQSVIENKVATLPVIGEQPGDIVFAFDATESMDFYLPSVKGVAEDIMLGLTADGLDVVFGVTAHQDYAGNYASFGYASPVGYGEAGNSAYRLAQTLTADVDQVVAALDTVTAEPAGDPPGSYSRALYETVAELGGSADPEQGALGYRAGARKMVALFGDDLPHDNDLNEGVPGKSGVFTTGGDPGRDGILQETSNPAGIGVGNDDLNWQTVIGLMGSRQVNLLSYELNPFYSDYWSHWASETGGELVYDYDMLLDGIRGRLLGSSAAGTVRLRPTAGYESWVTTAPGSYTDVALPASLPFEVTITPPVGTAPGVYSFSIELVADNQVLAAQSVQLTVSGQSNRAPVAVDDAYSVLEDSVGNVLDVLANDSDADGDVLAVASVGSAGHGTVTLTGGVVRYTPVANYHGPDSFSYTVSDGALTATATANLTVQPVNDAPVAVDDAFSVLEDSVENVLDVLANDSDVDGDVLAVASVGSAAHGTVTLTGGVVRYTPVANYHGPDSFSYTVSDGALTAAATANLTVQPVNDAPLAVDDAFTVAEDSVENVLDVLGNDTDIDGDTLTITGAGPASHGVVSFDGTVVRYTPVANYHGPDSFSYTVSDGALTAAATVNLTVQPVNDAPSAANDTFSVLEDSVDNVLDVLANDTDIDGDSLSITAAGPASHGVVSFDGTVVRYTPATNYNGPDSFSYTVSDGALTAAATVNLTVQPVNDAPSAADDAFSVLEDSVENVLNVLANDTDVDGDALTLVTVTQATNGVVTFDGNVVRYTPVANYNGPDGFTYTVSDGALTATANVAIVVEAVNDAPVANDDLFIVDENSVDNVLDVLANDTDVDGDALTITVVGSASHGAVTFDGIVVRYTPNAGYSGADAFTYTVSDGSLSDSATVELTVRNRNDAPVANDDTFTVLEDSVENVLDVLANDTDIDGDSLSITAAGPASHGAVTFDGAVVRYTPAANYYGPDSFSYTVSDGALTAAATVHLTVQPVNDAPVASDDAFAVLEDSVENVLAVLANDLDVDGDTLTIIAAGPASHGVVTFDGNVVRFTPAPNYNGADSFSYTVSDGALSDTATVNITVQPVNDGPLASDDTFLVAEDSVNNLLDVLANDLDVDGDTLSITGVGLASHGAVTVDGAVVRYTPAANYNGPDSFSYTVSDGALEASATVHITVQAVNDAPAAADDVFTVDEDSVDNALDVLANDTDIDGDALTLVSVGQAGHGTAVIAGTAIVYTPAPDFYGIDTFPYGISDGHGGQATALVTVTVSAVNDPPTLLDDEIFTELNTPVAIHMLANDHDVEGDPLTVTAISQPLHGTAVLHPDFSVTYSPNLDFVGTDSFSYTVTDGNGGLSTATVVISVKVPPVVYCSLYPIALYKGTLEGVNPGSYVDDILNGTQPGNFGWLTWSGNGNVPTLVNNLTPPGNSDTYVNPNEPGDHLVSINDWIRGVPGVKNARNVRDALDRLLGVEIIVPVWDATQGQGKNTTYQVFAFARVRLTAYDLSSPGHISAQFLSMTYCGETDIVADSRNAPGTPGEPATPNMGLFLPLVTTGHGVAGAGVAAAH